MLSGSKLYNGFVDNRCQGISYIKSSLYVFIFGFVSWGHYKGFSFVFPKTLMCESKVERAWYTLSNKRKGLVCSWGIRLTLCSWGIKAKIFEGYRMVDTFILVLGWFYIVPTLAGSIVKLIWREIEPSSDSGCSSHLMDSYLNAKPAILIEADYKCY